MFVKCENFIALGYWQNDSFNEYLILGEIFIAIVKTKRQKAPCLLGDE